VKPGGIHYEFSPEDRIGSGERLFLIILSFGLTMCSARVFLLSGFIGHDFLCLTRFFSPWKVGGGVHTSDVFHDIF